MGVVWIGPMRMAVHVVCCTVVQEADCRAEREVLTEVGLCAGKMFVRTVGAVVVVVGC